MQYVKALALLLLIVGGINWLLVGLMEFDLVASLTGSTFGETNPISTIVYTLVGLSALVLIPTLASWLSGTEHQAVAPERLRNISMKRGVLSIAAALLAVTTLAGTAAAAGRPDVGLHAGRHQDPAECGPIGRRRPGRDRYRHRPSRWASPFGPGQTSPASRTRSRSRCCWPTIGPAMAAPLSTPGARSPYPGSGCRCAADRTRTTGKPHDHTPPAG